MFVKKSKFYKKYILEYGEVTVLRAMLFWVLIFAGLPLSVDITYRIWTGLSHVPLTKLSCFMAGDNLQEKDMSISNVGTVILFVSCFVLCLITLTSLLVKGVNFR